MNPPTATAGPRADAGVRVASLAAALAWVAVAVAGYALAPHTQTTLQRWYALPGASGFGWYGWQFLLVAAAGYAAALCLVALRAPSAGPGKSLLAWRALASWLRTRLRPSSGARRALDEPARVALLASLLKAFFGPLMAMSLMIFCVGALQNLAAIAADAASAPGWAALFNRHGYWAAMQTILFVDVLLFTVGYLVESPRLGNEIRSVDPTWLGWAAALLCYPPFNQLSGAVLGSQVSDFPQFDDPTAHLLLNLALLALMAGYASASVALGWKASNLTHRGIVARGPYAWVRHPAYACKNAAWWIASLPLVSAAFAASWLDGVQALASVVGWTLLYALRALTEEDHLRRVDGAYAAYAQAVRWRFLPGVH